MSKLLIALSLAIITTAAACGGDRMTVEEYADACGALGDDLDSVAGLDEDVSSGLKAVEDAVAEAKRWNPPKELQEFHDATVRSGEGAIKALKETGALDLMREFEKAAEEEDEAKVLELMGRMAELEDDMARFDDQMSALNDEVERTQENLSPDTRQVLADANCL